MILFDKAAASKPVSFEEAFDTGTESNLPNSNPSEIDTSGTNLQNGLYNILRRASKYKDLGDLQGAIVEYKRFMYFAEDSMITPDIIGKLGLLYQALGDYDSSGKYIRRAYQTSSHGKCKNRWGLQLAVNHILSQDYEMAELVIIKLLHHDLEENIRLRILNVKLILEIYRGNWKATESVLKEIQGLSTSPEPPEFITKMQSIISERKHFQTKSEKKSVLLSTFIPGLGQIYSGDWKNGLNALILNTGLGFIIYNQIEKEIYLDAFLITISLGQKYYRGNLYHASRSARDYNKYLDREMGKELLSLLEEYR